MGLVGAGANISETRGPEKNYERYVRNEKPVTAGVGLAVGVVRLLISGQGDLMLWSSGRTQVEGCRCSNKGAFSGNVSTSSRSGLRIQPNHGTFRT